MNNKLYLLFLFLPFILIQTASAETGKNYDIEQIDGNVFRWTSHPDRIWDGSQWKNYVYSETEGYIRFESAGISFEFYKDTCDFKLYEVGLIGITPPTIDSFSHALTIDSVPEVLPSCSAIYTTGPDGMQITAERGIFKTIYDIDYVKGLEWFHEVENDKGRDVDILIIDTCLNCIGEKETDQIIRFGNYMLDTKNDVHGTVSDTRADKDNYIIEYEKIISNGEKLIIDPTFSYTSGTKYTPRTQNDVGAACPTVGTTTLSSTHWIYKSDSASSSRCWRQSAEWNIAGIPDTADVDSIKLRLTTSGVTNMGTETCDFNSIESQPSTLSTSDLWDDIGDGTTFLASDTSCRINQTYEKTLPVSAISDLETNLSGAINWWGIGILLTDETRDASDHGVKFDNIELEVIYDQGVWNPGPPILPTVTNNLVNQINVTWTPDNATGVTGYALWNNSANSPNDWEWDWLANTANFTETDDFGFYLHTGLPGCDEMYYKIAAMSQNNGTNATSSKGKTFCNTDMVISQTISNIGDTFKVAGTIQLSNVNITSITLSENGTVTDTNSTGQNVTGITVVDFVFWERDITGGPRNLTSTVYGQDSSWVNVANETKGIGIREYNPSYSPADENPTIQGNVNHTVSRFDSDDGIQLKVNRIGGTLSDTWQIECIIQTNSQAIANKNLTTDWVGTWRNETNTGYFNTTWTGFQNNHGYITCFNEDQLFADTAYTDSSLALFGISAFDDTWGSMIGVPAGVFFIVMTAGMANKRTAPTWIVVLLGIAGLMATVGFFSLDPIVWGLALISGMLGLFVNQKIF